mgnify:CR=1 FL=1
MYDVVAVCGTVVVGEGSGFTAQFVFIFSQIYIDFFRIALDILLLKKEMVSFPEDVSRYWVLLRYVRTLTKPSSAREFKTSCSVK